MRIDFQKGVKVNMLAQSRPTLYTETPGPSDELIHLLGPFKEAATESLCGSELFHPPLRLKPANSIWLLCLQSRSFSH